MASTIGGGGFPNIAHTPEVLMDTQYTHPDLPREEVPSMMDRRYVNTNFVLRDKLDSAFEND